MFFANLILDGEVLLCLRILLRKERLLFADKVIPDDGWRLLFECLTQNNVLWELSLNDVFPAAYKESLLVLTRGLSSPHCNLKVLEICDNKFRKFPGFGLGGEETKQLLGAVATNPLKCLRLDSLAQHITDRPESPILSSCFKWEHMTILTLTNMNLGFPSVDVICEKAKRLTYLSLCENSICVRCIWILARYIKQDSNRLLTLNISNTHVYQNLPRCIKIRFAFEFRPLWDALVVKECKLETLDVRNNFKQNLAASDYEMLNKYLDSFLMENFKVANIHGFLPMIPEYPPNSLPGVHEFHPLQEKLSECRLQRRAHWPLTFLGDFPRDYNRDYSIGNESRDKFYEKLRDLKNYFRHLSKYMLLIADRKEKYAELGDVFVGFLRQLTLDDLKNHLHRQLIGTARNPICWNM